MSSVVTIVVSERQWEELKGLMGTINQAQISLDGTVYAPLSRMISSLRLERVGGVDAYHVQLVFSSPSADQAARAETWPEWLEESMPPSPEEPLLTGNRKLHPSIAISRLFL